MLQSVQDSLEQLPGLSPREWKSLSAAGIATVQDVLQRFPRRYEDRRNDGVPLSSLQNGSTACLLVHVYSAGWRFSYKRYYELSVGAAGEPAGLRLYLRWFNMPYVARLLAVGMNLSIYGQVKEYGGRLTMVNPDFEVLEEEDAGARLVAAAMGGLASPLAVRSPEESVPGIHTGRIVPIYRAVPGISARSYRAMVWQVLQALPAECATPLGYDVAPAYPYIQAVRDVHFPESEECGHKARLRFALEECFTCQFLVAWRRARVQSRPGKITASCDAYLQEMLAALPFRLTGAQVRCLDEIRADMASARQMNRLLQGDVGSGKTLVALCAMLLAVGSGHHAALIAPTQILAEQHFNNFRRLLAHTDILISLRTSDRADDTGLVLEGGAQDASPRLIVGTHALLYKKNRPQNLGLAVIDEQHKFGVEQRECFIASGENPDVLVMTATPIPRTLTLTLYGDLDVSVIDELPANRGTVLTALRHPAHMKRIISFMRQELAEGRQIYIVSPLVEESEKSERKAATAEVERWKAEFPETAIGLLHGRLTPEEKEAVMADFHANRTGILVATTVVEVGVDVPNASIMLINDADSFGLSQLHQLRGRIGRGQYKGYCILLSAAKAGEPGREKLEVLCRTANGFEIAEEDFRLRGPGDVLGTAQSGLGAVRFPEWLADARLIHRASKEASSVLELDPELILPQHAPLRQLVQTAAIGERRTC